MRPFPSRNGWMQRKSRFRRGQADEWMHPALRHAAVPERHHFRNRRQHLVGVGGLESDAVTTVRLNFNNLGLARAVVARIAELPAAQAMQLSNRLLRDPQFRVSLVDESKRIAIAPHFFLVAIP